MLFLLRRAYGLAQIADGLSVLLTGRTPRLGLAVAKVIARKRYERQS